MTFVFLLLLLFLKVYTLVIHCLLITDCMRMGSITLHCGVGMFPVAGDLVRACVKMFKPCFDYQNN